MSKHEARDAMRQAIRSSHLFLVTPQGGIEKQHVDTRFCWGSTFDMGWYLQLKAWFGATKVPEILKEPAVLPMLVLLAVV